MRSLLLNFTLYGSLTAVLITSVSAHVARVRITPKDATSYHGLQLGSRDEQVCGGNGNMQRCGDAFPSNFCCETSATCLRLNTSSSVTAAICCPAGQDCTSISPVDCNQSSQDPSIAPSSQLHSRPTVPLQTCGDHCCPMGYDCHNNICVSSIGSTPSLANSTAHATPSSPLATASAANVSIIPATGSTKSPGFSGAAFAAGFIPGIILGGLITAIVVVCLVRRRNRNSNAKPGKSARRDTLTDLDPLEKKASHIRSISEPIPDPSVAMRTDFLRSSPSGSHSRGEWYSSDDSSAERNPVTPVRTPRIKALFSHSPFQDHTSSMTTSSESFLPSHMKRGTLSFKISPVRALRKQRSLHSLRRQATTNGRPSYDSSRRLHSSSSSSGRAISQETIKVVMQNSTKEISPPITPPRTETNSSCSNRQDAGTNPHVVNHSSTPPLRTPYASSSRYPTQFGTPPNYGQGGIPDMPFLGTPYTPTRIGGNMQQEPSHKADDGLVMPFNARNRDTTFSALMERAGLRKSELLMGPRK